METTPKQKLIRLFTVLSSIAAAIHGVLFIIQCASFQVRGSLLGCFSLNFLFFFYYLQSIAFIRKEVYLMQYLVSNFIIALLSIIYLIVCISRTSSSHDDIYYYGYENKDGLVGLIIVYIVAVLLECFMSVMFLVKRKVIMTAVEVKPVS